MISRRHITDPFNFIYFSLAFHPVTGTVVALRFDKKFVDEVSGGNRCGVLLDKTSFYAEQGGQLFDCGYMNKEGDEVRNYVINILQVAWSLK